MGFVGLRLFVIRPWQSHCENVHKFGARVAKCLATRAGAEFRWTSKQLCCRASHLAGAHRPGPFYGYAV